MKRQIIKIDNDKCNGCGDCIPNCPEGALKIIDGKARLLSDLFCDGLGACIGHCPQGAITIEEREAEKYDENKVMENIVKQGKNTIIEHLKHLKEHKQDDYLKQAMNFLTDKGIAIETEKIFGIKEAGKVDGHVHLNCPGSKTMDFRAIESADNQAGIEKIASQLRQWPIQLHLINPIAPYYQKADVLLVADCVAYALGGFHSEYLKGKSIAIACPKLDEGQEEYVAKIKSWLEDANINTLTVMIMQVPCCRGLLDLAKEALAQSKRKAPLKYAVVSLQGEILEEEWA